MPLRVNYTLLTWPQIQHLQDWTSIPAEVLDQGSSLVGLRDIPLLFNDWSLSQSPDIFHITEIRWTIERISANPLASYRAPAMLLSCIILHSGYYFKYQIKIVLPKRQHPLLDKTINYLLTFFALLNDLVNWSLNHCSRSFFLSCIWYAIKVKKIAT